MQPLSIRRLATDRIEQTLSDVEKIRIARLPPQQKLEYLCKRVMALSNAKMQDKSKKANRDSHVELPGLYELSCEKADFGEGFSLLFYSRQIITLSKLAQSLLKIGGEAKKMEAARVEMIGFLFRQKDTRADLFVLTTSDAWRAVTQFTDFDFPQNILMRLLDAKVHNVVYQDLVGNALRTDKDFKEDEELQATRFFDKFITQLTASLRPRASIYRLKSFCNAGDKMPKGASRVKIEMGAIRFQKQLQLSDYPALLDHLSKIHHREKTYLVRLGEKQKILQELTEEECDDQKLGFANYLKPVEPAECAALEALMDDALWRAFREGATLPLFFCHRRVKDYASSTHFRLVSRLISRTCEWDSPKTAVEILNLLREEVPDLTKCNTAAEFISLLKQIKIEFKLRETKELCSVRKMFGGEIRIADSQKSYFLVAGLWLALSPDYVRWVHSEFRKLLADCLIQPTELEALSHPWPTKAQIEQAKQQKICLYAEDFYNRSYLNEPRFLVGDRVLVEQIELFDLLKMQNDKLNAELLFYFVKSGFGQPTRDVASQMRVSAALIHEVLSTASPLMPSRLDQLCDALERRYPHCLQKVGGKQALIAAFERKKLTYVYALYADSEKSLFDDLTKKDQITESDVNVATLQALQRKGYISSDRYVTAQFRTHTQEKFKEEMSIELGCTKVHAKDLYHQISRLALPSYDSLIAPLELLKLRRQLEKKKQITFKICLIPRPADVVQTQAAASVLQAPTLPHIAQIAPLTVGSIFQVNGRIYQIEDTVGDGTCALHAAFGENINGRFYCSGGAAFIRESLANDLEACLNAPGSNLALVEAYNSLVVDLLLGRGAIGQNGLSLGFKLGAKTEQYRQRARDFLATINYVNNQLPECFRQTFLQMKNNKARNFLSLMTVLVPGLDPLQMAATAQHFCDYPDILRNTFHQRRMQLKDFFSAQDFPLRYKKPASFFAQFEEAENGWRALAIHCTADLDVRQAYLGCIKDQSYWFETNEVCLFARLRNQGLQIAFQNPQGAVEMADQIFQLHPNCRLIFHRGKHFMRCTALVN